MSRSLLTTSLTYAGLLTAIIRIAKRSNTTPEKLLATAEIPNIVRGKLNQDGRKLRGMPIRHDTANNTLRNWKYCFIPAGEGQVSLVKMQERIPAELPQAHELMSLIVNLSPAAMEILKNDADLRKESLEEAASKILEVNVLRK